MDDSPSPLPYALLAVAIALGVVLRGILAPLVIAVLAFVFTSTPTGQLPEATPAISESAPLNRLAVIDGDQLYTIDPDGAQRIDLAVKGQIPTAAVIWSRDGQRLIYAQTDGRSSRVISARPDGRAAVSVYEGDPAAAPFYLYGPIPNIPPEHTESPADLAALIVFILSSNVCVEHISGKKPVEVSRL